MAIYTTPTIDKYTVKEVLNKVINTDANALKVDIDNVTLITEGSDVNIEVHTDKAEDSMMMWTHTVKTGTGGTSYVPLIDSDGHLQVDTLSSALPSGAATAANQVTMINSLSVMDDWDDSNYANVNINIAGSDIAANAGAMSATTPRVTIATDDTHFGAVGAAADVDGVIHGQLRTIGTSLESLDNAVDGNYLDVNANIAGTDMVGGAGAVASGVQRITLASDDPAVVSLGNLDNAVDGNYLNINANIAGTDFVGGAGAVASGVQRVTLASDDPGVAALDKMLYGNALVITAIHGGSGGTGTQTLGATYESLYVGVGGDVVVTMVGTGNFTFKNLASGQLLPIRFTHVIHTNTHATDMIALKA
mgnify:CR=1 FL=1